MHGIHGHVVMKKICRYFYTEFHYVDFCIIVFFLQPYIFVAIFLLLHLNVFVLMKPFQNFSQHPCLRNTSQILDINMDYDYEEILNTVQRNTVCKEGACLRRKKGKIACRYYLFHFSLKKLLYEILIAL